MGPLHYKACAYAAVGYASDQTGMTFLLRLRGRGGAIVSCLLEAVILPLSLPLVW